MISVDANGGLTSSPTGKSTSSDNSQEIDVGWLVNAFTGVGDMLEDVNKQDEDFLNAQIHSIPFNQIKNFVFPRAKVFSYKKAEFSKFSDLACLITYVNPTDSQLKLRAAHTS